MKELSIALLLLSGVLKAQLKILAPGLPDVTLLAVFLVLLSFVTGTSRASLAFTRIQLLGAMIFFVFVLTVVLTSIYSSSDLLIDKLLKLLLPVFAFTFAMLTADVSWKRLAIWHVLFTFIAAIMFVYIFPKVRLGLLGDDARFYGGTYLGFADACVISIVLLQLIRSSLMSVVFYVLVIFFLFCILLSGARGPLIFFVLLMGSWGVYRFHYWLLNVRMLSTQGILSATIVLPLFMAALFTVVDVEQFAGEDTFRTLGYSVDRLLLLIGDDKGDSVSVRVSHLSQSLIAIDGRPLSGVGFASYGLSVLGNDVYDYPHNMFLEAWVESGLIAVILLIALVVVVFARLFYVSEKAFIVFIISYSLMNAMKSSSFADNRVLFFWLGAALAYRGAKLIDRVISETSSPEVRDPCSQDGKRRADHPRQVTSSCEVATP